MLGTRRASILSAIFGMSPIPTETMPDAGTPKRRNSGRGKPPFAKRLIQTANTLRKSRIKSGGPIKSPGIPKEIALEQSRKVSPRVVRNAAIKEARDFSRAERARIRSNVRPAVE